MKTELTTQESQKLIDLFELDTQMHFRIEDLLQILPPYITNEEGYQSELVIMYSVAIKRWIIYYSGLAESEVCEKELIEALYKLVLWYFNSKYTAK